MSNNHVCRKCNNGYILDDNNHKKLNVFFPTGHGIHLYSGFLAFDFNSGDSTYDGYSKLQLTKFGTLSQLEYFICPDSNCSYVEVLFHPLGRSFSDNTPFLLQPSKNHISLPIELKVDNIRKDLEEAYEIHQMSPRASIVLSRRALHSMIRNTFNLTKRNTLDNDITSLSNVSDINLVGPGDIDTLHKIRQIGNDGAHGPLDVTSQVTVSSDDAKLVLDFILSFVQKWYVAPELERIRLQNLADLHSKVK